MTDNQNLQKEHVEDINAAANPNTKDDLYIKSIFGVGGLTMSLIFLLGLANSNTANNNVAEILKSFNTLVSCITK